jgi:hypothetical protein
MSSKQFNFCLGRSLWTSNDTRTVVKNYKGIVVSAEEPEIKILTPEQEIKTIIIGWYNQFTAQISDIEGVIYIVH